LEKYNLVELNGDESNMDNGWLVDDDANMLDDDEYMDEDGAAEDDVLMSTRQNILATQLSGA
jgi:hypothetical protein